MQFIDEKATIYMKSNVRNYPSERKREGSRRLRYVIVGWSVCLFMNNGGVLMEMQVRDTYKERALEQLQEDAEKIAQLIKVQMDHLTMPQCPLYEEVLDTQMYGLSREIDFAVKLDLVDPDIGKAILTRLENEMNVLHELYTKK